MKTVFQSDTCALLGILVKTESCGVWCLFVFFKDALDHHIHPHLLPNVVFVVKRGILSCFPSVGFFLYFVHDSSIVLMFKKKKRKKRKMLEQTVNRHKKTNSRQLRMSDYCKMTNKEAMGLFFSCVSLFSSTCFIQTDLRHFTCAHLAVASLL